MNETPLIESERQPIWIVAAVIVGLIALLTGFVAIYRINVVAVGTQIEVIALNKKIEQMKAAMPKPDTAAQTPAPAAAPTK